MEYGFQAREFFNFILKEYLNPLFKDNGYAKEKGHSWIKTNGEILIRMSLERSGNNMNKEVAFRFYIQMCPEVNQDIKVEHHGKLMDWTWDNGSCNTDMEEYLPRERKKYKFEKHGWLGWYVIFREDACERLLNDELKIDFEDYLLPLLEKIKTEELFNKVRVFIKSPRDDYNVGVHDYLK